MKRITTSRRQAPPIRLRYGSAEWYRELCKRDASAGRRWLNVRTNGPLVRQTEQRLGLRLSKRQAVVAPAATPTVNRVRLVTKAGGGLAIRGRGILFYDGTEATEFELLPNFVERISPSVAEDIHSQDIRALVNHDSNMLLGRTSANTMRLSVDRRGVTYEIDLPESRTDIAESVRRGDLRGSSFSFTPIRDAITDEGTYAIRTLEQIKIADIGPVVYPAYGSTERASRRWRVA